MRAPCLTTRLDSGESSFDFRRALDGRRDARRAERDTGRLAPSRRARGGPAGRKAPFPQPRDRVRPKW